jgi:hypothetical protein
MSLPLFHAAQLDTVGMEMYRIGQLTYERYIGA